MKRMICLLAAVLTVCALISGCSSSESTLYDQGMKISALISEMSSNQEYLAALTTGSGEIRQALSGAAAADPKAPEAVYEITVSEDAMLGLLGIETTEGMSGELKASLTARSYAAATSRINALGGVSNLAASSLCTAELSFVNSGFSGNTIYLYVYGDAAPVMVSFSAGENNTVSASGCFILGDALSAGGEEEIQDYFDEFGAEVRAVKK